MEGVPPPAGRMITMSNEGRHALPIAVKELFQTQKVLSLPKIYQGLREMAISKTVCSKEDCKIAVDAAHSLDCPIDEVKAVISEVAWDIHGYYYVLKSSQDDRPFRNVVIRMFRGSEPNAKLRKDVLLEAAKRMGLVVVPNNEYYKVMHELCVPSGSVWVLKTGD